MDFTELEILRVAESLADAIWQKIVVWEVFAKDTIGKQLARSVDSVGANIAEAYGRYHFGDKLKFLYYARGSLFETKYWLNRSAKRGLLTNQEVQTYLSDLTKLAKQLNSLAASTRKQSAKPITKGIRETKDVYSVEVELFSSQELEHLAELDN